MRKTKKTTKEKKKRVRSTAYPAIGLEQAIAHTKELREKLGQGNYSRAAAAEALGHRGVTGSSARKIAALVHFGLLSREGNVYRQSSLADKILFPTSEEDKNQAPLEAIRNPKLFKQLIEKYGGQSLPLMLNNILCREYGVSERVAPGVAENFRQSAESAGILENGVLSIIPEAKDEDASLLPATKPDIKRKPQIETGIQSLVPLPCGVRIIFPDDMIYHLAKGEFSQEIDKLDEKVSSLRAKETEKIKPEA